MRENDKIGIPIKQYVIKKLRCPSDKTMPRQSKSKLIVRFLS